MAALGFERLESDSNLYFQPEQHCYMLCSVDDLLIFGDENHSILITSQSRTQATVVLCSREARRNRTWSVGKLVHYPFFLNTNVPNMLTSEPLPTTLQESQGLLDMELPRRQSMFNSDFFASNNLLLPVLFPSRRCLELRIPPVLFPMSASHMEVLQRHLMSLGITYPFGRVVWLLTARVEKKVSHFMRTHVWMHVLFHSTPRICLRHFR